MTQGRRAGKGRGVRGAARPASLESFELHGIIDGVWVDAWWTPDVFVCDPALLDRAELGAAIDLVLDPVRGPRVRKSTPARLGAFGPLDLMVALIRGCDRVKSSTFQLGQ